MNAPLRVVAGGGAQGLCCRSRAQERGQVRGQVCTARTTAMDRIGCPLPFDTMHSPVRGRR
jgi:hypothetical protein